MAMTVDELRDQIREEVGRYARVESTSFTKEALAAICEALDADIDVTTTTPPKSAMRAAILRAIDFPDQADADGDVPFRKAQLQAIADALGVEET